MILALGPWFDDTTGELLLSRQLLGWVGALLGHDVHTVQDMPGIWSNLAFSNAGGYIDLAYLVIGHSLIAIGLALMGGLMGRWFHTTGKCVKSDEPQQGVPPH